MNAEFDPQSRAAKALDDYLPKNLLGRYAFYVVLGTAVLIASISAFVTPASLVYGLLALPALIFIAALIVNFAIVFLEVDDGQSTPSRKKAAKRKLVALGVLILAFCLAWQPFKYVASASWRDLTLSTSPLVMAIGGSGSISRALNMIPSRRQGPVYPVTSLADLVGLDTDVSEELLQRLRTPSDDTQPSEVSGTFERRSLEVDGDLLRALSERPAVTISGNVNLRDYAASRLLVVAAREVRFNAGSELELGPNSMVILAEKISFGPGVRIFGYRRTADDKDFDKGQPASGNSGLPSGSLTLVSVLPAVGEVSIDLRGQDGRRGLQGSEINPIEKPAKEGQRRYSDYLLDWKEPEISDPEIETCKTLSPPAGFNREALPEVVTGFLDEKVLYLLREQACGIDTLDTPAKRIRRRAALDRYSRCSNEPCERSLCLRSVKTGGAGDDGLPGNPGERGGEGGASGVFTVATFAPKGTNEFPKWVRLTTAGSKGGEGGSPGPPQRGGKGFGTIPSDYPGLCPDVPEGPRGSEGSPGSPGSPGAAGAVRKPVFVRLVAGGE